MRTISALAAAMLTLATLPATACAIYDPLDLETAAANDIVVRGMVTEFVSDDSKGRITLKVTETYRGEPQDVIEVFLWSNAFGLSYADDSPRDIIVAASKVGPKFALIKDETLHDDDAYVALASPCSRAPIYQPGTPTARMLVKMAAE